MRILLDEDLPRRLGPLLTGHDWSTVPRSGWAGVKNGKLLALAAKQFDVLLTMDANLEYQQNLSRLPISVLVIEAASNRIENLAPLVPVILRELKGIRPRTLCRVAAPDRPSS
jgi:predicted nuclease of predicted toxin-antitoxin system